MHQIARLAALIGLLATPALAQTPPPGANPATGARPGNVIGTGQSLPTSSNASNITPGDTRSPIAPRLPTPSVGDDSTPAGYLRAARQALASGQTGAAQEALERAESRLLDRSVAPSRANQPVRGPRISDITAARDALASGDRGRAIQAIDAALSRPM
ncbi:MAG: hypothetical protein JO209_00555 [Acidisphaera sp.]|nr:hypothetical protein [Acidisphaera sp.]